MIDYLLLEDGTYLLLEDEEMILLEIQPRAAAHVEGDFCITFAPDGKFSITKAIEGEV